MKCLWVEQSHSLSDRPHQPGFVDKLGIDLTGFPMTEQLRKCRAAAMRALSKPNWPKYYHLLEPSSERFLGWLHKSSNDGRAAIDTYAWLRHIVFDLTLSLTYGSRFGEVNDEFMLTFIKSINDISAVRSSTKNFRHFVPLLRLWPESTSKTIDAERVRRHHRDVLFHQYQDRVAAGEQVDCIVAALDQEKLSEEEVHGICLSLLQAAPDTVASGVYQTIAWLSSPEGQSTQDIAYAAILEVYNGNREKAWSNAFREERVPLISSLNKETLRFFTFAPYATPRRTTTETVLPNGVVVPKGITLIMNAQEINHDETQFGTDSWTYKPDRYVGSEAGLPHVAFGAGVRICPAVAISNRIICAILTRMILAFEMRGSEVHGRRPNTHPIQFSDVCDQLVAHPSPYDCHFHVRDAPWLDRMLSHGS
ncbi:hypothetical protein PRZ48_007900 [Zasmidium cellare]|uniref:Cytochrome P450 n=1 Tax=Zasmidium cellare TaxID=395010 RepID=A0ABR0EKJ8_ZASCE|nr:hypothetical protein PRZ48_007900 [Zasmidium cellare]